VLAALPEEVNRLEIWTRLATTDYLVGASDPEGLLDFLDQASSMVESIAIRHSARLHAKIYVSDGELGLAGSANLTAGGFGRNQEIVYEARGEELDLLRRFVRNLRPNLESLSLDDFRAHVSQFNALNSSREALLDLIRQETLESDTLDAELIPYQRFLEFLETQDSSVASQILEIAHNRDGNNNTGKIKQAFYGVQRFLQLHPSRAREVADLPDDEWFEVASGPFAGEWRNFLSAHRDEESREFDYSIATLIGYLTPASGGRRTGGGGGDNQLKRVWPFVGRILEEN